MSITFADVTDISIPQGSVTKITETSSGRVLWDKYMSYMNTGEYYRGILKYQNSDENISYAHYMYVWKDSDTVHNNIHLGGLVMNDTPLKVGSTVNVGDQYTACYIRYPQQLLNLGIMTKISPYAKTLSDTIWTLPSSIALQAVNSANNQRSDIVSAENVPIKFSKLNGHTIKISSIKSDFSEYRNIFNNNYSVASKAPISSFPYLHGFWSITLSSVFLDNELTKQGEQIGTDLGNPAFYNKGLPYMYFYFYTCR